MNAGLHPIVADGNVREKRAARDKGPRRRLWRTWHAEKVSCDAGQRPRRARVPVDVSFAARILIAMDHREALETEFVAEVLRIVGPGADSEGYIVAPNTSDEVLEVRVQRLRELPSAIGHEELLRRVGPRDSD